MADSDANIENVRSAIIQAIEGIIGAARARVPGRRSSVLVESTTRPRRATEGSIFLMANRVKEFDKMVQGSSGILKNRNSFSSTPAERKISKDGRKRSVTFDPKFVKEDYDLNLEASMKKTGIFEDLTLEEKKGEEEECVEITRL